jgi:hypothetical protein
VLSNDIALTPAAALGARGTTLERRRWPTAPQQRTTFVGGAAEPTGYSIDQAEIARIFADRSVTISGLGSVAIRSFALAYGGTDRSDRAASWRFRRPRRFRSPAQSR